MRSAAGLPAISGLVRGRACDFKSVVLDDQAGKLHVPVMGQAARRTDRHRSGGELIVHRVVEFSIEDRPRAGRLDLDDLGYDADSRQLSIRSHRAMLFLLTVEYLDLTLTIDASRR